MISEFITGTHSVTSTEYSLSTDATGPVATTTDGIYQCFLDLSDMIAGDQLQIVIYEKCRTGDTQRIAYKAVLVGAQSQPIWVGPSLVLLNGWDITAKTLAGTSITVLWSIRKIA